MARGDREKVSPADIEKHLRGIDYPASREQLVEYARERHAPEDMIRILERLPDRDYDSAADVARGIGKAE